MVELEGRIVKSKGASEFNTAELEKAVSSDEILFLAAGTQVELTVNTRTDDGKYQTYPMGVVGLVTPIEVFYAGEDVKKDDSYVVFMPDSARRRDAVVKAQPYLDYRDEHYAEIVGGHHTPQSYKAWQANEALRRRAEQTIEQQEIDAAVRFVKTRNGLYTPLGLNTQRIAEAALSVRTATIFEAPIRR